MTGRENDEDPLWYDDEEDEDEDEDDLDEEDEDDAYYD